MMLDHETIPATDDLPPPDHSPRRGRGRPSGGPVETRAALLAAAERLFMARGYASVTVEEVVEVVSLTKPTLYHYFKDKEELYMAAIISLLERVGGQIRGVIATHETLYDQLVALAVGYFQHAKVAVEPMLRDIEHVLCEERAQQTRAVLDRELNEPIMEALAQGMARGELAQGDTRRLTNIFYGLLDGYSRPRNPRAPLANAEALARDLAHHFLHGVAHGVAGTDEASRKREVL